MRFWAFPALRFSAAVVKYQYSIRFKVIIMYLYNICAAMEALEKVPAPGGSTLVLLTSEELKKGVAMSLLELRQRLDALTAEQAALVDKILETKDDAELNAQLEMVTAEKQSVLDQIAACQQDAEQQAAQASRQREMEEWLDQQPMCFTEYDDTLTRRFVERITVVDAETIQVKIRDTDVVIDGKLC